MTGYAPAAAIWATQVQSASQWNNAWDSYWADVIDMENGTLYLETPSPRHKRRRRWHFYRSLHHQRAAELEQLCQDSADGCMFTPLNISADNNSCRTGR